MGDIYDADSRLWVLSFFIQIFVVGSEIHVRNVIACTMAIQGHPGLSEVTDFCTNRKRVCNFLLVITSHLDRILHRFGDTVGYSSLNVENRQFAYTYRTLI